MNYIRKAFFFIQIKGRISARAIVTKYYRWKVGDRKFCIISNDCWGGEMYKLLNRPFNTPFIGLMMMSPCYLKLLENPQYYLGLQLKFIERSKYESIEKITGERSFPIAVLGDTDIEIQFLHYLSADSAKEKWDRRVKRIDWQNLFIKYDCGKDYANEKSVAKFLSLPFPNKLIFGKENFGKAEVFVLNNYSTDGTESFKNSFESFNPVKWILKKVSI